MDYLYLYFIGLSLRTMSKALIILIQKGFTCICGTGFKCSDPQIYKSKKLRNRLNNYSN